MSLPDFSNNYSRITNFTQAQKCSDAKKLLRILLKRRYYSGGDLWESSWSTITSYLLENGLGNIFVGVDDSNWSSQIAINNTSFAFDNSEGKFNKRTDTSSLWYNSSTQYYIHKSKVEVFFGYQVGGTDFYTSLPVFSGLLWGDTLQYEGATARIDAMSYISAFQEKSIFEFFTPGKFVNFSGQALLKSVLSNISNTLGLSITSVNLDSDFIPSLVSDMQGSVYDFFEKVVKNTHSIFGINRKNELFLTYYNATYDLNTTSAFYDEGSITMALYACQEATANADFVDSKGANNFVSANPSLQSTVFSITTGLFGTARKLNNVPQSFYSATSRNYQFTATAPDYGLVTTNTSGWCWEALIKIEGYKGNPGFYPVGYTTEVPLFSLQISTPPSVGSVNIAGYPWAFGQGYQRGMAFYKKYFPTVSSAVTLGSGVIYPNRADRTISVPNDVWNYIAINVSYISNTSTIFDRVYSFYLNGVNQLPENYRDKAFFVSPTTLSLSSYFLQLGVIDVPYTCSVSINSMRISRTSRTQAEISAMNARIWGAKASLMNSVSAAFYNYGPNENVYKLVNYDSGLNKFYNKIVFPVQNSLKWQTEFYTWMATNTSVEGDYGVGFYERNPAITSLGAVTNYTYNFSYSDLDSLTAILTNSLGLTVERLFGTDQQLSHFIVSSDKPSDYMLNYTLRLSRVSSTGATVLSYLSIPPEYLIYDFPNIFVGDTNTAVFTFFPFQKQSDFVFINTLSSYEYGERLFNLEAEIGFNVSYSQASKLAQTFFASNGTAPKERLRVSTPLLENDLDLLDHVTVYWRPPYVSDGNSNDGMTNNNSAYFAKKSGPITWDSKEFMILSMTHDYHAESTEYLLREV